MPHGCGSPGVAAIAGRDGNYQVGRSQTPANPIPARALPSPILLGVLHSVPNVYTPRHTSSSDSESNGWIKTFTARCSLLIRPQNRKPRWVICTGKCEGFVTVERRTAVRQLPRLFVVAGAPEVRRLTTQVHSEPQCLGCRRHGRDVTTQAAGVLAGSTWRERRRQHRGGLESENGR